MKTFYFLMILFGLFITNQLRAQDTDGDGVLDSIDIDDDNDGILDIDEATGISSEPSTLWINIGNGLLIRVDEEAGNINTQTIGNMGFPLSGDIGIAPDGTLYAILGNQLYAIDKNTAAATFIGTFPAVTNLTNSNALTFDQNGFGYIGASGSGQIYRFDPKNLADFSLWYDFGPGFPSGDFIFSGNFVYISWSPNLGSFNMTPSFLYRANIDAFNTVLSFDNLGTLPNNSFGMASDSNGDLFVLGNNNEVFRLDVSEISLNNPLPLTLLPELSRLAGGQIYFGATSNNESTLSLAGDTDGDGLDNRLDLDSDNDGISDFLESGANPQLYDQDGNNIIDGSNFVDNNGNGLADGLENINGANMGTDPLNTDSEGDANFLDLDSDNDGCPDFAEGTAGFNPLNGQTAQGDLIGLNLGNNINANGIPTSANGGQGVGDSRNAAISGVCLCELTSLNEQLLGCNDNGTPSDFSDDFFEIVLDPTGFNLGTEYTVSVNGGLVLDRATAGYGAATTFRLTGLSLAATDYELTVGDANDAMCSQVLTFSAQSCSSDCSLASLNEQLLGCNDAGTPSDFSDDFFEIVLDPTGFNLGTEYTVSVNGGLVLDRATAGYGAATTFRLTGLSLAATDYELTVGDANDAMCSQVLTFSAQSCSSDCSLASLNEQLLGCNDNGTPSDFSDDFFEIVLDPTGFNLGTDYTVSVNGGLFLDWATASYGTPTTFQLFGLTETDTEYIIRVSDGSNNSCTLELPFLARSCSDECEIVAANERLLGCNDNGTPYIIDKEDDFIEFVLFPEGRNTEDFYTLEYEGTGSVVPERGIFGVETVFRLNKGSADGITDYSFTIRSGNTDCSLSFDLDAVEPCSLEEFPIISNDLIDVSRSGFSILNIENIENFPNNTVKIYNRWGRIVYETKGYDNRQISFNGNANNDFILDTSKELPAGVYYYMIEFFDTLDRGQKLNGYLYIK